MDNSLEKVINIYNKRIFYVIKIEPLKAFKFYKKNIDTVIENIIKSKVEINENKISI